MTLTSRDGHPALRFNRETRVTARIFSGSTGRNWSFSTRNAWKIPGSTGAFPPESPNQNRNFSTGTAWLNWKNPHGFSGSRRTGCPSLLTSQIVKIFKLDFRTSDFELVYGPKGNYGPSTKDQRGIRRENRDGYGRIITDVSRKTSDPVSINYTV